MLITCVHDPTCRVAIIHPRSAGYGLNLQDACPDVLFVECPLSPIEFNQVVGRVDRNGQKRPVTIRIAVAENTIQMRLHQLLLAKDALANAVQGGWQDLRDAMYGK